MVLKCCVCRIDSDDPRNCVSFHKLPAREGLRDEWMKVLRKHCASITQKYLHVCSQHFQIHCFQYSGMCRRRMLKGGSVPTIFPHFEVVECYTRVKTPTQLVIVRSEKQGNDRSPGSTTQLQTGNEELTEAENQRQLIGENIEKDSTSLSPQENFNQLESEKTFTEKEMMRSIGEKNAVVERLRRENKNLKVRLGRCRKKIYRYKHPFEALKRT